MGRCEKIHTPTALVLLGATGDLAQKKLLSALTDLTHKDVLPEYFHIIAFSKDELTTEEYRDFARSHIDAKGHNHDPKLIESFLNSIEYIQGMFDDKDAFERVKTQLEAFDATVGTCASKLFYLAVPPIFYDTIFEQLAAVNLEQPCTVGDGWTRILVEKPFGSDLENAQYLEKKLSNLFKEEQIYRIDHYLAKDAIQNILAFRFSNGLFEHNWNKDHIEAVSIKVFEKFDVSNRGAFFDGVGALRDVGQNHMLQMLALVAMENPKELTAIALREKRTEVLRSLRIPKQEHVGQTIVKGQYEGYRTIADVADDSNTDTYFAIKTYIDNAPWKDVPFYLEHGKAMSESGTEVSVRFRSSKHCVCGNREPHDHSNIIRFTIAPEQKISVRFWVRKPGLKYELEPNDLVFDRHATLDEYAVADAYEEVLFDAICGDQTLFVSNSEQEAAWKYITTILELWKDIAPLSYTRHTDGPSSSLKEEINHFIS